ncbi:hypothetical protein SJAG_03136 [Schizosaccharomyces japonicus yFS275]|uniref:Autophagy-related protein 16 domain-containing protein n=1 Tax=Schizosaccharomyces japonicus (strain yFS275 / FY16936) TaxID=402676 RepID=B6K3F2_SCHJY|nr:hypothetical protein SJAG_03136 [Schizosaccharomyces japonicus yFS275]EEB08009.1 hypothetical protein SJAG_03136 [Schizosaccharomyces japonicus yFS275]
MELEKKLRSRDIVEKSYYEIVEQYHALLYYVFHETTNTSGIETAKMKEDPNIITSSGVSSSQTDQVGNSSVSTDAKRLEKLQRDFDMAVHQLKEVQETQKRQQNLATKQITVLKSQLGVQEELNEEKNKRIQFLQDELLALQLEVSSLDRQLEGYKR